MAQPPNVKYLTDEERAELKLMMDVTEAKDERKRRKPSSSTAAARNGGGKGTKTDRDGGGSGEKRSKRNRREEAAAEAELQSARVNEEIQRRFKNLTDFIGEQLKAKKKQQQQQHQQFKVPRTP